VKLHHDVDLVPDTLADLIERFQCSGQIPVGDVKTAGLFGGNIKRLDFHGRNTFGEERLRKIVRSGKEVIQVVKAGDTGGQTAFRYAPIGGGLGFRLPHILSACTRVVRPNTLAGFAAEQLENRLPGVLSE
jgi:hypothetical protein